MNLLAKQIGVWGDSILKGVVLDDVKGNYQMLKDSCIDLFQKHVALPVLNRSRFGFTVVRGRRLLEKALERELACDMVLLEYGGNDCDYDWQAVAADPQGLHQPFTPLADFCHHMEAMISALKQNNIMPVLMSLPPIHSERYYNFIVSKGVDGEALMQFLGDVNQIYKHHEQYSLAVTRIAYEQHCLYLPVREAFLEAGKRQDLTCLDGIHPNQKGHQLMQEVFLSSAGK